MHIVIQVGAMLLNIASIVVIFTYGHFNGGGWITSTVHIDHVEICMTVNPSQFPLEPKLASSNHWLVRFCCTDGQCALRRVYFCAVRNVIIHCIFQPFIAICRCHQESQL